MTVAPDGPGKEDIAIVRLHHSVGDIKVHISSYFVQKKSIVIPAFYAHESKVGEHRIMAAD